MSQDHAEVTFKLNSPAGQVAALDGTFLTELDAIKDSVDLMLAGAIARSAARKRAGRSPAPRGRDRMVRRGEGMR